MLDLLYLLYTTSEYNIYKTMRMGQMVHINDEAIAW